MLFCLSLRLPSTMSLSCSPLRAWELLGISPPVPANVCTIFNETDKEKVVMDMGHLFVLLFFFLFYLRGRLWGVDPSSFPSAYSTFYANKNEKKGGEGDNGPRGRIIPVSPQ